MLMECAQLGTILLSSSELPVRKAQWALYVIHEIANAL